MDFCNENFDIYFFVNENKNELVVKVNDEKKPKEKNTETEQNKNENEILTNIKRSEESPKKNSKIDLNNKNEILTNVKKNNNKIENKKISEEEKKLLKKLDHENQDDLKNYLDNQIIKPYSKNKIETNSIYTKKKINNEKPSNNVKNVETKATPYLKKKLVKPGNSKPNENNMQQKFKLKKNKPISSSSIHSVYRYYDENELPSYFYECNENDVNEKIENKKNLNETTLTTQVDSENLTKNTVEPCTAYNDSFENASKEIFFRYYIPLEEKSVIMPSEFKNLTENTKFNSIYSKKKINNEKPFNNASNKTKPTLDVFKNSTKKY